MRVRKRVVLKFGGTSMGSPDSVRRVVDIVRQQARGTEVVTVVSAMKAVTDSLLELGHMALTSRPKRADSLIQEIYERHEQAFRPLLAKRSDEIWMESFLKEQFSEIREISHGILLLREFSEGTRDKLVSYGEVLSSMLLARSLQTLDTRFCHSDARDWIVAERTRQDALLDYTETERLARGSLLPLLRRKLLPVVPGFICRTKAGRITNLGRNGSDYSAAIVGAVAKASEIWIYTDVDGIMTADPTLVTEATILSQISYQEAAEMSYFGAKVIHPKTMIPAVLHRIPIRIKNTFNPQAGGTLITSQSVRRPIVKTVTSVRDLALLNIQGNGMVGIPGVSSRVFEVMGRESINVIMISQSSSEHSICMVMREEDANRAAAALRKEFEREIERNLIEEVSFTPKVAIVAIIGAGMRGTPGISGKFFEALGKYRINVLAIAQGSSELNISAAILEKDYRHAVQAIHTAFGLTRDLNVFLFGCGNIGRMLLRQIHENRRHIARALQVNLKILGVATSRRLLFSVQGLPDRELEQLASGAPMDVIPGTLPRPSTEEILRKLGGTYKSDVVLVDATGAEFAPTHIAGLLSGFHVVTANKKPLTSSYGEYMRIHSLRRRKGLNYQYEATFGAGLPLLSTLQDLIHTGDRVLGIQGCLSGTLGFLCSRLDEGVALSEAVSEAVSLGYSEPDPRDDLSGLDVARKALIIARELGIHLELGEIRLNPMIPRKHFKAASVAAFLKQLPQADAWMNNLVRQAREEGMALRYLADITAQGCAVSLQSVPRDSPIGRLAGPDNILVFQTQRYFEHPLVIQGPGAGAAVTSAGVLGDLLKIAKSI